MSEEILLISIYDGNTGETIEREMTAEEILEHKEAQTQAQTQAQEINAKNSARASALVKLAELGLTEEEVGAL